MNLQTTLEILYILVLIGFTIKIIDDSKKPSKAAAYILLIFALPVIGIIIYLSVGLNYRKSEIYSKKLKIDEEQSVKLTTFLNQYISTTKQSFDNKFSNYIGLNTMLFQDHRSLATVNNQLKILTNGEGKFPELFKAIRNAKHHIHVEYYIFNDDEIGNEFAELLIEKAKEGIKVRFIYDDFGSLKIRKKLVPRMIENGVEAYAFYKITFIFLANRMNYRNHRKIVIVDGKKAFVGGINVSDQYVNKEGNQVFWRDTHLMIEGEAVNTLQKIFFGDWNYCANQNLTPTSDYFKPHKTVENGKWVQISASGPDSKFPSILFSYLQILSIAKKDVFITTPYLIPSQELIYAMNMAILRGVKIKILIPEKSDSRIVNTVCKSYFTVLLEMGVELYLYQKGFIHAKTLVCDDDFAVIGTANLDHRSFDLNFEVNANVYDQEIANELKAMFYEDLQFTKKLELEEWEKRGKGIQMIEKALRIVAPLM